jgi:hypothetical protein
MEGEVITKQLGGLSETAENLPDRRKSGNGRKYEPADFLMSAFAVFYFQHPSIPDFQKAMEEREKRNNLRTLSGVETIPGTGQVRKILDGIEPKELSRAFDMALGTARESGRTGKLPCAGRNDTSGSGRDMVFFIKAERYRGYAVLSRGGMRGGGKAWQAGGGAAAHT